MVLCLFLLCGVVHGFGVMDFLVFLFVLEPHPP